MSIAHRNMTSFSLNDPLEPQQLVLFRLAGRWRGLASDCVVRIAELHHCAPVPSDLRCNLGLVVHRDVVAGLVDLEMLERLNGRAPDAPEAPTAATGLVSAPPFFCIFARFPRGVAGFPIDCIPTLARPAGQNVDPQRFQGEYEMSSTSPDAPPDIPSFAMVDLDDLEIFT